MKQLLEEAEVKGLIDNIIIKLKILLNPDKLRAAVGFSVRRAYNKGFMNVDEKFDVGFNLVPNRRAIEFLQEYTYENIKDMNDDMLGKLRKELSQALMNREGIAQIKQRISDSIKVGEVRSKAIAITETHRAYNFGNYQAAEQTGLKLKKKVMNPNPKSEICRYLTNKPGIMLNKDFRFKGEKYFLPPFHVNCKSYLEYIQEESQ